jgi:predicted ATP-grasp superfamily ATP-dependent carboligase
MPDFEAGLPPAILLGADMPMGLAVVRELGEHGVQVHAVANSARGVGPYSKWATTRHIRPRDEQATIDFLNDLAAQHGAKFLLVVSEPDLVMVRGAQDAGRFENLRALIPEASQLAIVQDKSATYEVARRVGLPVPVTWQPEPGPQPPPVPAGLRFPCILKWANAKKANYELSRIGLGKLKAEYCYDADELRRALARYAPIGNYPLVQSFFPGHGLGQMVFMHKGEPLIRFQHRRVAEWPPEGGSSTVCESLPVSTNADLFEKSVDMLRSIEWEGPAMVEYRFDPRTGRAMLMEVNGRFWGSLPLAYHAGAHFGWYTYAVLGLGRQLGQPDYKIGLRCRFMIPETKRIARLLRNRGRTPNRELKFNVGSELRDYLLQFLSPRSRYYVFSFRDPMPFLHDIAGALLTASTG